MIGRETPQVEERQGKREERENWEETEGKRPSEERDKEGGERESWAEGDPEGQMRWGGAGPDGPEREGMCGRGLSRLWPWVGVRVCG